MSSLVSVNGPSMTVRLLPENLTRVPFELGWSPSPASITPAFASSSLYLPISASSSVLGMTPASESLFALTITMNLGISLSPFSCPYRDDDRDHARSTLGSTFLIEKGDRSIFSINKSVPLLECDAALFEQ